MAQLIPVGKYACFIYQSKLIWKSLYRVSWNSLLKRLHQSSTCHTNASNRLLPSNHPLCIYTLSSTYPSKSDCVIKSSYLGSVLTGTCVNHSARTTSSIRQFSQNHRGTGQDPNQQSRRQKLTFFTYLSCGIGVCLVGTILFEQFRKLGRSALGMEAIKIREYGHRPFLFRYRGFILTDWLTEDVKSIHEFPVRDDDIWLVSFPKSGILLETPYFTS